MQAVIKQKYSSARILAEIESAPKRQDDDIRELVAIFPLPQFSKDQKILIGCWLCRFCDQSSDRRVLCTQERVGGQFIGQTRRNGRTTLITGRVNRV